MTSEQRAAEIARRERWLEEERDTLGWLKMRPQVEAELAALKAHEEPQIRCGTCGKSWRGKSAQHYRHDGTAWRCAGVSACAERVRNANGRKQGARV